MPPPTPSDPLSISSNNLPSRFYRKLVASRARTDRLRRGNGTIEGQIIKFVASALALFVVCAFVLVSMIPSPAFNSDSMTEAGVDSTLSRPHLTRTEATDKQIEANGDGMGSIHVVPSEQRYLRRQNKRSARNDETATGEVLQPHITHVLETRFMQMQPNLVQLAKARLRLFKAICLPSILHQTAWGRFLWIIRTDPELDAEIKEELVEMLKESGALAVKDDNGNKRELTYLIGSNDNYIVSNTTTVSPDIRPFDYLDMLSNALSNPTSIFAGKASSMQKLFDHLSHRSGANDDVIMWTRLDADDGLNVGFMEYLQHEAIRYFLPSLYNKNIVSQLPNNYLEQFRTKYLVKYEKDSPKQVETHNENNDMTDGALVDNVYVAPQWTYWCSGQNIDCGAADDVIMWTRLDADDGLNVGFMEYLQHEASSSHFSSLLRYFLPSLYNKEIVSQLPKNYLEKFRTKYRVKYEKDAPKQVETHNENNEMADGALADNVYVAPQWTYWCSGQNIDWFLTDPSKDPKHKEGKVYPVAHENLCVTPGVTLAMRRSFDPLRIPRLDHDRIISYLRPRGGEICERKGASVFERDDGVDLDDGTCFHMITNGIAGVLSHTSKSDTKSGIFPAVRSRTPTSAGMKGVVPDINQVMMVKRAPKLTEMLWKSMKKEFHISNDHLQGTTHYFAEHIYDISEENARGQCTVGHSCKASSKDLLQQYVDLKGEMVGGFNVINGQVIAFEAD
ncbi:hypothetical protein ACHAWF_010945 [Thalassiosira exigua]